MIFWKLRLEFRMDGNDSKEHVWKFMNKDSAKTEVNEKQCRFGESWTLFMKINIWLRSGENKDFCYYPMTLSCPKLFYY